MKQKEIDKVLVTSDGVAISTGQMCWVVFDRLNFGVDLTYMGISKETLSNKQIISYFHNKDKAIKFYRKTRLKNDHITGCNLK